MPINVNYPLLYLHYHHSSSSPNRQNGIAAMIGPQSAESALHVQSICDAKEMPYIETRWDPVTKMSPLSVHPDPLTLGMVFVDLVKAFEWKSFTVLFENGKFCLFKRRDEN